MATNSQLWLSLLLSLLRADVGAAEGGAKAKDPFKVFSPNPPECASNIASSIADLTTVAGFIIQDTADCALALGWYGDAFFGNKAVFPEWHNQRVCAVHIIASMRLIATVTSDLLAAAYNCFNDRQACGQAIAASVGAFLDVSKSLVIASNACTPTGTDYPFLLTADIPLQGWSCWVQVWRIIAKLIKGSKFIDVALSTCPTVPPLPEPSGVVPEPVPVPVPEPGATVNATAPQPVTASTATADATPPQPVAAAPVPVAANGTSARVAPQPEAMLWQGLAGAAPSQGLAPRAQAAAQAVQPGAAGLPAAGHTATWEDLEQPTPFALAGRQVLIPPVERRLSAAAVVEGAWEGIGSPANGTSDDPVAMVYLQAAGDELVAGSANGGFLPWQALHAETPFDPAPPTDLDEFKEIIHKFTASLPIFWKPSGRSRSSWFLHA